MSRWLIVIEAWPHSTGAGQAADQEAAGERTRYFYVDANSFDDAAKLARCFADGVGSHPRVWEAPIVSVSREKS
jgi:hypothetical protein